MFFKIIVPLCFFQSMSSFGASNPRAYRKPIKSIAEMLSENESLSTLLTAVEAADLGTVFSDPGEFTVFAPNNEAFEKIPPSELSALLSDPEGLSAVLLRHVLPKKKPAEAILFGENKLITCGGDTIIVSRYWRQLNISYEEKSAFVLEQDIRATNGVIHIIDNVI